MAIRRSQIRRRTIGHRRYSEDEDAILPTPMDVVADVYVAPDIDREDEDAILPTPMDVVVDVYVAPDIDREDEDAILPTPMDVVADVYVAPDIDRENEDAILPTPMDVVVDVQVAMLRVLKVCSTTSIVSTPGKTRARTNRTRVRVTSAVVTSSSYKNMMEDGITAMATTSAIVRPKHS